MARVRSALGPPATPPTQPSNRYRRAERGPSGRTSGPRSSPVFCPNRHFLATAPCFWPSQEVVTRRIGRQNRRNWRVRSRGSLSQDVVPAARCRSFNTVHHQTKQPGSRRSGLRAGECVVSQCFDSHKSGHRLWNTRGRSRSARRGSPRTQGRSRAIVPRLVVPAFEPRERRPEAVVPG